MTFTHASIQACRAELAAQVQAYRDLVGAASKASGMSLARIDAALAAFEPAFFGNLLVALDARFARRARGAGASAEVALLAAALLHHGGVLQRDAALPGDADTSLLRIEPGDRVALNADDVETLAAAFLAELDRQATA
ncbi:MAG: hypothetical protein JF586_08000 [Burkholderiales bacterium]|nr:hypothetical protein [Burkholderiales bacterium]